MSLSLKDYYSKNKHPRIGKVHSEETKQKMKYSSSKKVNLICPYCNIECNSGNAKRWHFDNCKHKI